MPPGRWRRENEPESGNSLARHSDIALNSALPRSLNPNLLILRGVISIAFGILALVWPGPGLLVIALLYGAYAFIDGLAAIGTGVRRSRQHLSWGLPIFEGILGVAAGVLTYLWPGITLYVLSILVGIWALATGILEIAGAFNLRTPAPLARPSTFGRALLGLAGVLSIILGIAIFAIPALGAITLLWLVAIYSLAFGALMISLGVHLRRQHRAGAGEIPKAA